MNATARMVTGCDLVDIRRFAAAIERRPGILPRVFTQRELTDAARGGVALDSDVGLARLAARFAAKEAARKALRNMRLPFHDVEVRSDDDGAPQLWFGDRPSEMSCSLSHDGGMAMAVVVGVSPETSSTPAS